MFGKKTDRHPAIDTLVGPGSRVTGDLSFDGGCHIDGDVAGNVTSAGDSSAVSVSEHGTIEGDVSVPHVILNGTVTGDVYASARVELRSTARVVGNVYYNLIEMAIGAEINGKLVHKPDARPGHLAEATGDTKRMPAAEIADAEPEAL